MDFPYKKNILSIEQDIKDFDIDNKIRLIVVTKSQTIDQINKVIGYGYKTFAENYVDEAIKKIKQINDDTNEWHFIGKIQSNKIKNIVEYFNWVQTISSTKHAEKINEESKKRSKLINACIQINIDNEHTKSGLDISDIDDFAEYITSLSNIKFRGIMAIPSKANALDAKENSYAMLNSIYKKLRLKYNTVDTLSIGMSNDYKIALKNGSNMIRIGTLIFGERN
tara:strand:+ start:3259 stop:3930 length:672 start_codon:yes stop_codon:yes gene_type:complete